MLFRLLKYLRGYVLVSLWGYSPERFFNLCNNHEILLWDIRFENNIYYFKVSIHGFRRLRPLLKKTRTKLRIEQRIGLPFFLFRYRRRKILFLGMAACLVVLFTCSRFLWKVEIHGNSSVTDDSILQFLAEHHSSYGTLTARIDCERLEEELRSTFEQVIWTSMKREGTSLTIDIQENLAVGGQDTEAMEEFQNQEESGYDLTALHTGTIRSILVRKGQPMAKAGDQVSKGAILVSGAIPIYSDEGEIKAWQFCTADADVSLETDYTYKKQFPRTHEVVSYTGNQSTEYGIQILDRSFFLRLRKQKLQNVTMTENRKQLKLCSGFYLPVYWVVRTYEEYEVKQISYTKKEAKEHATQELSEYLQKLTQKGILILEKNVMISVGKKVCRAKGTITVLEQDLRYQKNTVHKERDSENESG